ncbi:MAG: hypothetical protein N2Z79_05515, partial [Candidatus Omnitrophica bacterium]|nr:hypothetical protein [Candidatus Omnitrophota bacterium]
ELRSLISDLSSWSITPQGYPLSGDRSILIPLENALRISNYPYPIRAIKIKGIVNRQNGRIIEPPSLREYFGRGRPDFIYDFTPQGRVIRRRSSAHPTGFMLLADAEREYLATKQALLSFQSSFYGIALPLGYGEYIGLKFRGKRLGFVIAGLPTENDLRFRDYLDGMHLQKDKDDFLKDILPKCQIIGRALRAFHEAGWIHSFPHLGNFAFVDNKVYIYDLENAFRREGLSFAQLVGYLFLDLCCALNSIPRYCSYEQAQAFLKGYFYDLDSELFKLGDIYRKLDLLFQRINDMAGFPCRFFNGIISFFQKIFRIPNAKNNFYPLEYNSGFISLVRKIAENIYS